MHKITILLSRVILKIKCFGIQGSCCFVGILNNKIEKDIVYQVGKPNLKVTLLTKQLFLIGLYLERDLFLAYPSKGPIAYGDCAPINSSQESLLILQYWSDLHTVITWSSPKLSSMPGTYFLFYRCFFIFTRINTLHTVLVRFL